MADYSKVQFIAWEIYTGPAYGPMGPDHYPGIAPEKGDLRLDVLSQCVDIFARVEFTRRAIETAYGEAEKDPETLKIFMAPEFLYRGAGGAYLYDLLTGWTAPPKPFAPLPPPLDGLWEGLVGELRSLVAEERFQDWVFVFGSAVGAGFPFSADEPAGRYSHPVLGRNLSLIQCGGRTAQQRDACYFTEKHLKSPIDFIDYELMNPELRVLTDDDVAHGSEPSWKILDRLIQQDPNRVGGSLFRFPHIRRKGGGVIQFGLEICLDHAVCYYTAGSSPTTTGRLAMGGARVDIQLVPSCGMSLIDSSLALGPQEGPRNFSYAFNCDGLQAKNPGRCGLGTHIQLWNELEGEHGYRVNELVSILDGYGEAGHIAVNDTGADLSALGLSPEDVGRLGIDIQNISARQLWYSHKPFEKGKNNNMHDWPEGPGFVRLMEPQPLADSGEPPAPAADGPQPALMQAESVGRALRAALPAPGESAPRPAGRKGT